jgi:Right handed beta helix region
MRILLCIAFLAAWLAGGASACAATYQVGPARTYHAVGSLPSLSPGDIVEIDPATYNEVKRWTRPGTAAQPIIVRGVGAVRPVFDATGLTVDGAMPNPRAVFQVEADYITLENLEFQNARNGDNGAGIRVTSGNNVTVTNCRITMCDMGIMCDNNSNLVIEASEIASNGTSLYDGYSHNFYLGGNSATVQFCYIHDSLNGQNFKTRAHYTELLYNYIADSQDGEVGLVDAAETAATNSHAVMIGNIIISKPRLSGYNSGRFIQFGQDSGGQHNGTLYAFDNTFVAGDGRIQFLSVNAAGATVAANNNVFCGSDKIVGTLGGGISGSNNWMQPSATVPATFYGSATGSDPGFVNRAARDLHLTAGSGCRNRGLNTLLYLDGTGAAHSGLPTLEYVNHLKNRPRPGDGQADIGAYEYRVPGFSAIRFSGNDCLVDFTTAAGNQYNLQSTSNLAGNFWSPVSTNIQGTDGIIRITDTNAITQARRFYRVQAYP